MMKAVAGHCHLYVKHSQSEIGKSENSADANQMTAQLSDPLGWRARPLKGCTY